MTYSNRIAARFAQFPADRTELVHGGEGGVKALGFVGIEKIDHFITINWAVAATAGRGLPVRPYTIEIAAFVPDDDNGNFARGPGDVSLSKANGHRWDVDDLFGRNVNRPWGILCLGLVARADQDGGELFCRSFDGSEINGTRLAVGEIDRKCAFFGPNIFEICATADITISHIAAYTLQPNLLDELGFELVASVGPAFKSEDTPTPWPYDDQSYLQIHNLKAKDALRFRQLADRIARSNTPPPTLQRLIDAVHQQDPSSIEKLIDENEAIQALTRELETCLKDPSARFETRVDSPHPTGSTDTVSLTFAQILQLLAHQGPVEALTLGTAVTIPRTKNDLFTGRIESVGDAFDLMSKGRMPFPLIMVRGQFFDAALQQVVEEFAFAGLDLLVDGQLKPKSSPAGYFEPEVRDEPATAAIRTRLHSNSSSLILYASEKNDAAAEQVIEERGTPRAFCPSTPDADESNAVGAPQLWLGSVAVPLTAERDHNIWLHPRDVFGRWPISEEAPCHLFPRPVGAPDLISCQIHYAADEVVSTVVAFEWDRSVRSLQSAAFGLAFSNMSSESRDLLLLPSDGLSCPAFLKGEALILDFDVDGKPINVDLLPAGVTIAEIRPAEAPADTGREGPVADRSRYELTIRLGTIRDIMALRKDPANPLLLNLVVDAIEHVSGTRRTEPPLPRLSSEVHDPRPPVLDTHPWAIIWTALPNGETNEARASLELPRVPDAPRAVMFNVWRSQETAVLNFALHRQFSDAADADAYFAAVRSESNPAVRLGLIQRLIEPNMKDPAFMKALSALFKADPTGTIAASNDSVEIQLPAQQTGFEFVLFTATSRDGVQSSKIANPCMRVVAIPRPTMMTTPGLRLISWDDAGYFEVAGLCLAIASYPEPFDAGHVRFYWDHGGAISDANELRFNLRALAELSLAEATAYIANINKIIQDSMPFEHNRIFMLMPPMTVDLHHFAIEFQTRIGGGDPTEQIPTPRSPLESLYLRGGLDQHKK